jgi:hypothetical protein
MCAQFNASWVFALRFYMNLKKENTTSLHKIKVESIQSWSENRSMRKDTEPRSCLHLTDLAKTKLGTCWDFDFDFLSFLICFRLLLTHITSAAPDSCSHVTQMTQVRVSQKSSKSVQRTPPNLLTDEPGHYVHSRRQITAVSQNDFFSRSYHPPSNSFDHSGVEMLTPSAIFKLQQHTSPRVCIQICFLALVWRVIHVGRCG